MDDEEEVDETPRKMTKREKRTLAIQRAKDAMEADKKRVDAVKARRSGKPIPEEPKPVAKKSPRKIRQPPAEASNDEEMDDASVEDVKPEPTTTTVQPPVQQQQQQQPVASQPVQALPVSNMKSPPTYSRPAVVSTGTNKTILPVAATETEDDDDDMPPPMSSLESQISEQVLANFVASETNQPAPHTQPPPAAFSNPPEVEGDEVDIFVHDEHPIVIDDEHLIVLDDDHPNEKPKRQATTYLILAIIVAIVSYILVQDEETTGETVTGSTAFIEAPCFKDNVMIDDSGVIINSCAGNTGVECPDGGTCKFGKLVECIGKHYEISDNKDKCILTSLSLEKVSAIQAIMEELTSQSGCHIAAYEYPLFPYKDIQLANPLVIANNPLEVSILENEFNVERINGVLHIGLSADHKFPQPFYCEAIPTLTSLFGGIGSLMAAAFHFILAVALEIFKAYPIPSSVVLVVSYAIRRFLMYRAYRSKLAENVSEIRQIAYTYLEDDTNQSHLVLHVRDHIVMKLYPRKERKYLIQDVWPRVVPDFKCDNRIRKTTRVVEGQPREAWQWVAAVSSVKKKKPLTIQ